MRRELYVVLIRGSRCTYLVRNPDGKQTFGTPRLTGKRDIK
jgi:hypothetical protein